MTSTIPAETVATMPPLALVERAPFADAIGRVSKVVERRNTIPILGNVLLTGAGESLSIDATDLDIWMTVSLPGAVDKRLSTTVPAHTLRDCAKAASSEFVEAVAESERLALDFEGAKNALPTLPAKDWPEHAGLICKGAAAASFTMPAKALQRQFGAVSLAISTEETRYYLNGIFWHTTKDDYGKPVLGAVATDGHRLMRATMAIPPGAESMPVDIAYMPGVIVPRKTVALVLAELKRKGAAATVSVDVAESWIRFTIGDCVIRSKLVDGTFPDYCRVIPQGNDKVATVEAKPFAKMVKAVSKVSTERGRAVRFGFEAGKVLATVNNPDIGSASQSMPGTYEAAPMDIGFNGQYIAEIVAGLGAENINIRLADPGSPTRFEPAESPADGIDVLGVCMPLRV